MKEIRKLLKKDKKKLIIQGSIIVLIIVLGVVIINFAVSHANPNSADFLKDQRVDGLLFTRTKYETNKLIVIVKNESDEVYNLKTIDVTFKDNSGNEITTVNGYIGDKIEANGKKQLVVQTDIDLSSANTITYTINK